MIDGIHTEPFGLTTMTKGPIYMRLENNMRNRAEEHKMEYKLGCGIREFMRCIEKQFRVGMCWRNYGVKWELDHIIPVSYVFKDEFLKLNAEKQKVVKQKIVHYSNIQPLFNSENAKKRPNITKKAQRMLQNNLNLQ